MWRKGDEMFTITRKTLIVILVVALALTSCASLGGGKSCKVVLEAQYYLNDININSQPSVVTLGKPVEKSINVKWIEASAPEEGSPPGTKGKNAGWEIAEWSDLAKQQAGIQEDAIAKAKRLNSHFRGLSLFDFTVQWPENLPKHVKDLPKGDACPDGGFRYQVSITLSSEAGVVQTDVSQVLGDDGKPTDVFFSASGNGWHVDQFTVPYASLVSVLDGNVANGNVPVKPVFGSTGPEAGLLSNTIVIAQGVWLKEEEPATREVTVLLERIAALHPTGNQLSLYVIEAFDSIEQVKTFSGKLILETYVPPTATATATTWVTPTP